MRPLCMLSEDDVGKLFGKLLLCSKDHPIFLILNRCVFYVFLEKEAVGVGRGRHVCVHKEYVWEVQRWYDDVVHVTGYLLV